MHSWFERHVPFTMVCLLVPRHSMRNICVFHRPSVLENRSNDNCDDLDGDRDQSGCFERTVISKRCQVIAQSCSQSIRVLHSNVADPTEYCAHAPMTREAHIPARYSQPLKPILAITTSIKVGMEGGAAIEWTTTGSLRH